MHERLPPTSKTFLQNVHLQVEYWKYASERCMPELIPVHMYGQKKMIYTYMYVQTTVPEGVPFIHTITDEMFM